MSFGVTIGLQRKIRTLEIIIFKILKQISLDENEQKIVNGLVGEVKK